MPVLYRLESIDGWFKTNFGLIWHDKTTRNVDEHFHYTFATALGYHVYIFYKTIGTYSCMLTKKLSAPLLSFLASSSLILSDIFRVTNAFAFHIQTPTLLVKAVVSRFEFPWQIFAKCNSCLFSCSEIYALPEKRCFQFFLGVLTYL